METMALTTETRTMLTSLSTTRQCLCTVLHSLRTTATYGMIWQLRTASILQPHTVHHTISQRRNDKC